MKFLLLLSIFVVGSCGKIDIDTRLNSIKSIDPIVVEQNEKQAVLAICNALAQKAPSSLVNTAVTFKYAAKACNQDTFPAAVNVNTTIQNTIAGFKFVLNDGSFFFFSDIETTDKGSMAPICAAAAGTAPLTSPLQIENDFVYFSTINVGSSDCKNTTNGSCITIERAIGIGNNQARVYNQEWIRFLISSTQGRLGFFDLKRQVTSGPCPEGQELANKAEL